MTIVGRAVALAAVAVLLAGIIRGSGSGSLGQASPGETPHRLVAVGLANDTPHAPVRTYGMGWGIVTPHPTVAALLQMVPVMAQVSEYAIIQREAPWARILAGDPMDKIVDEEFVGLVDFLRGSGLKLVILVDPLDGLNRRAEAPSLTALGRSIMEPEIRALHEEWVRTLARRLHPEYMGLASEINTLGARGDPALYGVLRDMVNGLVPDVHALSPQTKVFVSFQVDDAWERPPLPDSGVDQFTLLADFPGFDVLGLSSYPGFFFEDPADIPSDYYRRFAVASGKPLIQVEGGWSSTATSVAGPSTPELQAAYFRRLFQLLDGVDAELVVLLVFADLDLDDPAWGMPADRLEGLRNFATMGVVTSSLQQKPAYAVWEQVFERPLVPPD